METTPVIEELKEERKHHEHWFFKNLKNYGATIEEYHNFEMGSIEDANYREGYMDGIDTAIRLLKGSD